jgi:hypothetical protein
MEPHSSPPDAASLGTDENIKRLRDSGHRTIKVDNPRSHLVLSAAFESLDLGQESESDSLRSSGNIRSLTLETHNAGMDTQKYNFKAIPQKS